MMENIEIYKYIIGNKVVETNQQPSIRLHLIV